MMRPQRAFIMGRSTALQRRKTLLRFVSITASPFLILHAHGKVVSGDARIVDENIDAAMFGQHLPNEAVDVTRLPHLKPQPIDGKREISRPA